MTAVGGSLPSPATQSQPTNVAPIPPPARSSGNRGLYITLGALIVIAVLVAAGFGVPRWFGTRANDASSSQSKTTAPPQSDATAKPTPAADDHSATPAKPEPPAKPADAKKQASAKPEKQEAAPAPPPGPDPAEVAAVEQEVDQLSGRQAAINASLENLQQQQQQQGYQLRGDMVAAQASMNTALAKAQSASQAQDLDSARRYLKQAETQVEKLEKFLGR